MKITAYEVREDETEIMKKLADKLGIDELVTTAEPLTLDTAHLAKGAAVISMVHCGLGSLVAFAENKEYRCQLQ